MRISNDVKAIDFSVIIPAYNAGQFITRPLDSVANQTYSNFEILITNDGSTDNTEEIIQKYIDAHPTLPIYLSSQNNKGIGSARNNGILRARGRYLAFLDADDYWCINKLEKVYKLLLKNPDIDVVYHDEYEIRNYGKKRKSHYGMVKKPVYDDLLFNGNKLSTSATVIKRELAQRIGGFSENLDFNSAEDYDFWLRLAKNDAKFYYIPIILGEYHRVANSVSMRIVYHGTNSFNVIKHHINLMMAEEKHDRRFLQKKMNNLKSKNVFDKGRAFFLEKDYKQSCQYYLQAHKHRFFWWKPYAGLLQCFIAKWISWFISKLRKLTLLKSYK